MSASDPNQLLGQRENEKLEFKSAEILKNLAKIGREVVGFLNHEGGEIWIGVQEKEGVAVPPLQDIPGAQKAINALRDHLMATIEPPIRSDDFELEPVSADNGATLIRIAVAKGTRGPYAQIDRGRHFLIRVRDRLHEMSRQEIDQRIRGAEKDDGVIARTVEVLRKKQEGEVRKKPTRLWIRLQPTESLDINFDDDAVRNQFRTWLTDAKTTHNRATGSNFVLRLAEPRPFADRVEIGDPDNWFTEVKRDGQLTFAKKDALFPVFLGEDRTIVTYSLLEHPVSLFRFWAEIFRTYGRNRSVSVVAAMAISGLLDARLVPGSPGGFHLLGQQPKVLEDPDIQLDPARLVFSSDEILENPDRCGMKLARLVYYEFGFDDRAIPPEFDAKSGKLLLS